MLPGMSNLSYSDRLRTLNIPTLAYRRLRGDMIEVFKMMTGRYDDNVTLQLITTPNQTRGHYLLMFTYLCRYWTQASEGLYVQILGFMIDRICVTLGGGGLE